MAEMGEKYREAGGVAVIVFYSRFFLSILMNSVRELVTSDVSRVCNISINHSASVAA